MTVSASERVRVFLLYDNQRNLSSVVLLEEVRAGLFDTRAPVALTSLVGEWRGQAETFRHPSPQSRPLDSAKYSPDDLPPQLKNPSSTGDGLLRTATTVSFAWDPAKATVRRATILRDMSDNQLGSSVVYGLVDEAGMFDIARFDTHSSSESLLLTLTNACFISAPIKRIRGVSASAELACLVTPTFRRRILRIYGTNSVVSDTLASESLI